MQVHTAETAYGRNVRLYPLKRCRCGAEVVRDQDGIPSCPRSEEEGELEVYHDVCLQNLGSPRFWKVAREGDVFLAHAGYETCPTTFPTERLAWEELEKAYRGEADWMAEA